MQTTNLVLEWRACWETRAWAKFCNCNQLELQFSQINPIEAAYRAKDVNQCQKVTIIQLPHIKLTHSPQSGRNWPHRPAESQCGLTLVYYSSQIAQLWLVSVTRWKSRFDDLAAPELGALVERHILSCGDPPLGVGFSQVMLIVGSRPHVGVTIGLRNWPFSRRVVDLRHCGKSFHLICVNQLLASPPPAWFGVAAVVTWMC